MEKKSGKFVMSTIVVILLFFGAIFVASTYSVSAAQDGDYIYLQSGGFATITGYTGAGGAITIPSTLGGYPTVAIGEYAFLECDSLTSVTIPNSVTTIGYEAFEYCTNLTSVTIPNSITSIGTYAFHHCTNLTSVIIPNSVTSIRWYSFAECTNLTSVTIGSGVTTIEDYAFYDCTNLTSVTLPNSVTSIGEYAFDHCTSLAFVTMGSSVATIGNFAFQSCTSLTSVTIGSGVTSIGDGAFIFCTALTAVNIPNSVISIGNSSFYDCASLTSITIPNSVTSIGQGAFTSCIALTSVSIGSGVTVIGNYAFTVCTALTSITVNESNANYASVDNVLYNKTITTLVQCPGGRAGVFAIPNSVTTVGFRAFYYCTALTSVVVPNSVTSIREGAFQFCTNLTSVTIGNGVTSIWNNVFRSCAKLTSITFLGLTAPSAVGVNWVQNTDAGIRGHAYAASNFPAPGGSFHGLTMGDIIQVVPGIPTGLVATPGNARVNLNWTAPSFNGESNITGYNIYRSIIEIGNYSQIASPSGSIYNDTGLTNDQTYWYKVSAVNDNGESTLAGPVNATPVFGTMVPTAPRNINAEAGIRNVTLTWDAPLYSNASAVVGYLISFGASPDLMSYHITWNQLVYVLDDLTKGQTLYFNVAAENNAGWGPNSRVTHSTPFGVPDAPTSLIATAGSAQANLSWSVPAYTGPGTLIYHLFRDNVLIWSGSGSSHIETGLTNGVTYDYVVSASNDIGWGPNSSSASLIPQGAPSTPIGLIATPSNDRVSLNWTAPANDGGSLIIGYKVYRSISETGTYSLIASPSGLIYNDTGLTNGQTYWYKVSAVNAIGVGSNCSAVSALVSQPTSPLGDSTVLIVVAVIAIAAVLTAILLVMRKSNVWRKRKTRK